MLEPPFQASLDRGPIDAQAAHPLVAVAFQQFRESIRYSLTPRTTVLFAALGLSALLAWAPRLRGSAAASGPADPALPTNVLMTIVSITGVANTGPPDQATISSGDCLS